MAKGKKAGVAEILYLRPNGGVAARHTKCLNCNTMWTAVYPLMQQFDHCPSCAMLNAIGNFNAVKRFE